VVVVLRDGREKVDFAQSRGQRYDNELGDVGSGEGSSDVGKKLRNDKRKHKEKGGDIPLPAPSVFLSSA
jgi:hypothetical protein